MKQEQITQFLKTIGAQNIQAHKRTGWVLSRCPLGPWKHEGGQSGAEVFGVRVETGDPRANCFSCGWHGKLGELVISMRHLNKQQPHVEGVKWGDALRLVEEAEHESDLVLDSPDIEEMLFGEKAQPHVFPDWWLDSFASWKEVALARKYLSERNVPSTVAEALDIRWDSSQKRVCFPVRDFAGRLMGLHGRATEDGVDPRYRMYTQAKRNNPIIWLGESWVDLAKPIVVVEGPFDLASVYRVYRNVVSPLFSNPSVDKLKRMADCLEWITFLDRGVGGDTGRSKMEGVMHKDHVVHHIVPPPGRKDPGACTADEIAGLLQPLVPLDKVLLD